MTLIPAKYASAVVAAFTNILQRQINPANPAVDLGPTGKGSERRRARELEKARRIKAEDAERKKRMTRKVEVSDIELRDDVVADGSNVLVQGVYAFGSRIGSIRKLGDKFVLYDNAAKEVSERARARDLKKAATALYEGRPETKMSRQVRRRLARKGR